MMLESVKNRLDIAIRHATVMHANELDGNGMKYIFHPLTVMLNLQKDGADDDTLVAAVLHDVISSSEDKSIALDTINSLFGEEIGEMVNKLTREKDEIYKEYIERIISYGDIRLIKIKKADIKHNLDISRIKCEKTLKSYKLWYEPKYLSSLFILDQEIEKFKNDN